MKNATWFGIHPIVAVAFALLLPGCGITTVSLSDYNTSCSVDTDCMAVAVGEVCGCACANAAINRSDSSRYLSDFSAARSHCSGPECRADCAAPKLSCSAGTCKLSY
jgi:hypothetical protein